MIRGIIESIYVSIKTKFHNLKKKYFQDWYDIFKKINKFSCFKVWIPKVKEVNIPP